MVKTILFDLDGTLTDPGEGITNSVEYALNKFGVRVEDKRTLYPFIGPPLVDSFMEIYGFSKENAQRALEIYREYFSAKGMFENAVYDGIPRLLSKLRSAGKTLVVATSKPQEFSVKILEHFGLAEYFDYIAGASMDEKRNKKADVIAYAVNECGIDVSSAVMVGDRKYDVLGAAENGISTVGVTYGYGDEQELKQANAKYIADSVNELGKILLEI